MQEQCSETDLALQATKVIVQALGPAMSTLVVLEHHLWLNLAKMSDAEKVSFLDAPIFQGGVFGDSVEDFSQQFSALKKQTVAIRHILPRSDSAATYIQASEVLNPIFLSPGTSPCSSCTSSATA